MIGKKRASITGRISVKYKEVTWKKICKNSGKEYLRLSKNFAFSRVFMCIFRSND
jgi:hypothetical protein